MRYAHGPLVYAGVPSQHPAVGTEESFDDRDRHADAPGSAELGIPSSDISPMASDIPPSASSSTVTDAQLRAFLAHPDAQKRIRAIVAARLRAGAPEALRDDIVQQTNVTVLTTRSRPRSLDTAQGWLAAIATRAVARQLRADGARARWLDTNVAIDDEDGPAAAVPSDGRGDGWLLSRWLAHAVAGSPRDQETLELLCYQADSGKTHADVAAEHATTEDALRRRVARFKSKYLPRYRRRRTAILVAIYAGAFTLALLGWLFYHPGPEAAKRPKSSPPVPSAIAPPAATPSPIAPADPDIDRKR
jgi:DNA-directed RNA polymerase specialized sigma24 family protein